MSETLSILITGASRGIGRAAAVALARAGYEIVVHASRASEALDETLAAARAANPACEHRALTFDVCDREAAQAALNAALDCISLFTTASCPTPASRLTARLRRCPAKTGIG